MFSLHSEALAWLRYSRRMPILATEVGPFAADVLGLNSKMCVEVEIKKSISDLRAEFRAKVHKHLIYGRLDTVRSTYAPNWFYFLVPVEIAAKALPIIEEKFPRAGLAAVTVPSQRGWDVGKNVSVLKRPQKLHDRPPSSQLVRQTVMRMASEICHFRVALEGLKKQEVTAELCQKLLENVQGLEGSLDFEDVVADVERRGKELASVMEPGSWNDMSHLDRIKYLFRAQELLNLKRETVMMPEQDIT